jgi:hypothetical protein
MMERDPIEANFEASPRGMFMRRWGAGRATDGRSSRQKLCFVATDRMLLARFLLELSWRPECHFVKYSTQPRDGMYLGRCFVVEDRQAGAWWREFKSHPRLMCSLQDDRFTEQFRPAASPEALA